MGSCMRDALSSGIAVYVGWDWGGWMRVVSGRKRSGQCSLKENDTCQEMYFFSIMVLLLCFTS